MTTPDSKSRIDLLVASVASAIAQAPAHLREQAIQPSGSADDPVHSLLDQAVRNRGRLQSVWRFYFFATVLNYVLTLATLVGSLAAAIVFDRTDLATALGGGCAGSLLSALLWKPHSKLLVAQSEYLRLDGLASALSILLGALGEITDAGERAQLTAQAIHQIGQIAASKDSRKGGR